MLVIMYNVFFLLVIYEFRSRLRAVMIQGDGQDWSGCASPPSFWIDFQETEEFSYLGNGFMNVVIPIYQEHFLTLFEPGIGPVKTKSAHLDSLCELSAALAYRYNPPLLL